MFKCLLQHTWSWHVFVPSTSGIQGQYLVTALCCVRYLFSLTDLFDIVPSILLRLLYDDTAI